MKKTLLLLLVIVVQQANCQQFQLGFFGSFNKTELRNENIKSIGDELNQLNSFNPAFGLQAYYQFKNNLSIGTGLNINLNKQRFKGKVSAEFDIENIPVTLGTIDYESKLKFTTIAIPLMFRYTKNSFYAECGPQFSFLIDGDETTTYEISVLGIGSFSQEITANNIKNGFNNSTVDLMAGLGGLIRVDDNIDFLIGCSIGYGLTDLFVKKSETDLLVTNVENISIYQTAVHFNNDGVYDYRATLKFTASITAGLQFNLPQKKSTEK